MDIPLNVGTGAKDYITLKEGVVRPTLYPGLVIYDEGSDTMDMVIVYESVVKKRLCAGLTTATHEPGEEAFGLGECIEDKEIDLGEEMKEHRLVSVGVLGVPF